MRCLSPHNELEIIIERLLRKGDLIRLEKGMEIWAKVPQNAYFSNRQFSTMVSEQAIVIGRVYRQKGKDETQLVEMVFDKISKFISSKVFFLHYSTFYCNLFLVIVKLFRGNYMNSKSNKKITILGMDIWNLFAYFIIYSIAGFFVETIFAFVRYGVLESRKSFLYGPFCSIYGLGAVIMILFLQYFKKNRITLFIGGFIIGSITEYLVSLVGEFILHVKWWDYSNMPLNVNGRICFYYSIFWGILAIFLMKAIHPKVRKLMAFILKKINLSTVKSIISVIMIFILVDCIVSAYAISLFRIRMIAINNLNVENKEKIIEMNENINESKINLFLIHYLFNDKKMIRTYPNLKQEEVDGNIVYFKDLLPDIKQYYLKIYSKDYYK